MNVCIVASGDFFSDYGGGQVYVRNIVDELALHPNVSTSVISFNTNEQPSVKDYHGIPVCQVDSEESLQNTLNEIKPDIVHANGEKLTTSRVCKQLNIPCIVTAHHGGIVCPAGTLLNTNDKICGIPADYSHCLKCYLRNSPTGLFWHPLLKRYSQSHYCRIGKNLEKLPTVPFLTPIGRTGLIVTQKIKDWQELCTNATHFIAPSNAIAEALKRNSCPQEKISVIPHGIPNTDINNNSQFSILNSQLIKFYYVGRINYVKGIHILLKAFTSIDNPNIELHLIGGAVSKEEIRYNKRLQRKYHRDNRIVWHGKIPNRQMTEILKDFHCLVHPAIYLEVFGLNISEALALHKYVIATRCGGPEMQIHSETEGVLVKPNDVVSLADAINGFIHNPKHTDCTVHNIKEHIVDLIGLYNNLLH